MFSSLAIRFAIFLGILPNFQKSRSKTSKVIGTVAKFSSITFFTYCSYIVFSEALKFPDFFNSVQNTYKLLWSAGTFVGYFLLLIQKNRLLKSFDEISKIPHQRGPHQTMANFMFLFANFYQIFHFIHNTHVAIIVRGKFKFNCQYYVNFALVLMDFVYADFLLLYKDMFSMIISQIEDVKKSNEPFWRFYLLG